VANLWGVHNDPKAWPNPEKFNPYRHIDQDGKFVPSSKIIPFSVGPRFCLGESLARAEIFIFLSKLLKNFTILPDENGLPSLDGFASIVYHPFDFHVKLQKRNWTCDAFKEAYTMTWSMLFSSVYWMHVDVVIWLLNRSLFVKSLFAHSCHLRNHRPVAVHKYRWFIFCTIFLI